MTNMRATVSKLKATILFCTLIYIYNPTLRGNKYVNMCTHVWLGVCTCCNKFHNHSSQIPLPRTTPLRL